MLIAACCLIAKISAEVIEISAIIANINIEIKIIAGK